jgi:hypothetical protein
MKSPHKNEAHIMSVIYVASFPLSTLPDLPILYEMTNYDAESKDSNNQHMQLSPFHFAMSLPKDRFFKNKELTLKKRH